jgi:hypothetical protein
LGLGAAALVAISCVVFSAATVLVWLGVLVPPGDVIATLVPSLVLAPSFLVLMGCVHQVVPPERKIWSNLGLAFAGLYAPLVAVVYVVALSVVEPRVMQGQGAQVALLSATHPGAVLWSIDGLGYVFMSLAALFAAPAFGPDRLGLWIRRLLFAHGAVGIPVLLTYYVNPSFISVASLWGVTLTSLAILLAIWFRRQVSGSSPDEGDARPVARRERRVD